MYNTRVLKAKKLEAPTTWADLLKPEWFGHVGLTSPSRSGTTHLTVETILQGEGWDKGWNTMLRISGNAAAMTDRSFGVPDGYPNPQAIAEQPPCALPITICTSKTGSCQ